MQPVPQQQWQYQQNWGAYVEPQYQALAPAQGCYQTYEPQQHVQQNIIKTKLKPLKWKKRPKKSDKTEIFMWGKSRPRLFPVSSDQVTPYHVDSLSKKKIRHVFAAKEGHHCFGIGQNSWCFVWGETTQTGALGLGNNSKSTVPYLVRALRQQKVKQACCSAFHSLCITDQFVIYAWGSKRLTCFPEDTNTPTPMEFLNNRGITKLAACNTHSLAWNPDSIEIWSFGVPGPWLGFDDDDEEEDADLQSQCGVMVFDDSIANNPNFSITYADCSSEYSLIISNTGSVGACGVNEHGRMGAGVHVHASAKVLWNRTLQNIVLCSAGPQHAGFVDTDGRVFTCGEGSDFRLGHGDKFTVWEPKLVEACKRVQVCQIECGDARTFIITPNGNLITWGKDPVTGRTRQYPFIYEYLTSYRVYDICVAQDFCVVVGVESDEPIAKPKIEHLNVESTSFTTAAPVVSKMNRSRSRRNIAQPQPQPQSQPVLTQPVLTQQPVSTPDSCPKLMAQCSLTVPSPSNSAASSPMGASPLPVTPVSPYNRIVYGNSPSSSVASPRVNLNVNMSMNMNMQYTTTPTLSPYGQQQQQQQFGSSRNVFLQGPQSSPCPQPPHSPMNTKHVTYAEPPPPPPQLHMQSSSPYPYLYNNHNFQSTPSFRSYPSDPNSESSEGSHFTMPAASGWQNIALPMSNSSISVYGGSTVGDNNYQM